MVMGRPVMRMFDHTAVFQLIPQQFQTPASRCDSCVLSFCCRIVPDSGLSQLAVWSVASACDSVYPGKTMCLLLLLVSPLPRHRNLSTLNPTPRGLLHDVRLRVPF